MHERSIVVMAKEPEPGRVKTRLCPPLAPVLAAALQEAFIADLLERLGGCGCPIRLYGAGDAMPRLADLARRHGVELVSQCPGHLGVRMLAALQTELRRARRVAVLGADSPDLPLHLVEAAFEAVDRSDICLGPASDGGYYLLAVKRRVPHVALGADIPWGTDRVLAATRAALATEGLGCLELDAWSDVDDVDGLRELMDRLAAAEAPTLATTREVLAAIVRSGVLG